MDIKKRLSANIQSSLHHPLHQDFIDALAEIQNLQTQNERYRVALSMIGYHPYRNSTSKIEWYEEIAQQALTGETK